MTPETESRRIAIEELTDEQIERAVDWFVDTSLDLKLYRTEWWLRDLYHLLGMNTVEIAELLGLSDSTVYDWMDRHDIPRRTGNRFERKEYATYSHHARGYPKWDSWSGEDQEQRTLLVHRLLAVAEFGFDAVSDNVVHHKNGIKWDNRRSNLELMSHSDHSRMHGKERAVEMGWYK